MIYLSFFITISLSVYGLLLIRFQKKDHVRKRMDVFFNW